MAASSYNPKWYKSWHDKEIDRYQDQMFEKLRWKEHKPYVLDEVVFNGDTVERHWSDGRIEHIQGAPKLSASYTTGASITINNTITTGSATTHGLLIDATMPRKRSPMDWLREQNEAVCKKARPALV